MTDKRVALPAEIVYTLPVLLEGSMRIECLIWIVLYIHPGLTQSSGVNDSIPCERGWFYFRDKCYKLGGKRESGRLDWKQAAAKCNSEGGNLVTIGSQEVQEFLVTFLLLDAKTSVWIGLHDQANESNYFWNDSPTVNYTNWPSAGPSGPALPAEDCVEMVFLHYQTYWEAGQWNDGRCSYPRAYICEAKTSRESSPDPRLCANGGWKHLNTCYHVIPENKSWDDAEQHCQNIYNGHLTTILDYTVDLFLQHILSYTGRDVWIGIKIQEQSLQQWESGWHVGYSEWEKDESDDFVLGTCAVKSKRKSWKKVPCSRKYSFICEAPSVGPPVPKQPVKGARCPEQPEEWLDLGGEYCYFFDTKSKVNWYRASMECNRRGGSLVSIHSEKESVVLQPFIKYTQNSIHIGLLRSKAHENVFIWTDGSRLDYKNWDTNEPKNADNKCGEMFTENMKWKDSTCDLEIGYICSVRKVSPNITQHIEHIISTSSLSVSVVVGVCVCILLVVILIGFVIYCFRTGGVQRNKTSFGVELQPPIPSSKRPRYRSSDSPANEDISYYENMG